MHLLIKTLCLQWHIAESDTFTVSRHCHCKQYALYLFINQSLSQPSTTFYEQLFTSSPQNLTHFDFESVFSWPLPPYFFCDEAPPSLVTPIWRLRSEWVSESVWGACQVLLNHAAGPFNIGSKANSPFFLNWETWHVGMKSRMIDVLWITHVRCRDNAQGPLMNHVHGWDRGCAKFEMRFHNYWEYMQSDFMI